MTTLWPALSPATRGRLAQSSLSELLATALERRLDGSFVFETVEGAKSVLVLERGQMVKARTAEPVEPIGQRLLQADLIDDTTLQSALQEAAASQRPLGQVLIERHAVSAEALLDALGQQLGQRLTNIARLPSSSAYGFYDRDFLPDWLPCEVDPLALIWIAQRDASGSSPRQLELLRSLIGRKLRLHPAATPERLGLSSQEQFVITALRARPRAIEELQRAGLIDVERLQRLIYALALTHQLDHGQQAAAVDANLQRNSRPPLGSHPALARPGARSLAPGRSSLRPGSVRPPSLPARELGPTPTGPRRSPSLPGFQRPSSAPGMSRPPSLPALRRPSLPGLSRPPTQPPARPSGAAPLAGSSLPPARERSSARAGSLHAGSLHPSDPAVLARARECFEAACEHVQRQQLDVAEKLARKACEEDTGNAEYLALHAWLRAQLGQLSDPEQAAQIVAALDRAVLKDRESVAIRFYRGQVLNRLGREEDAVREFRFVLRRDPGNVDALRELRLYEMRKRDPQKKPSLLAKLFLR